jgi:V/A-type H+/Na+-transporting ATPase subunit E
MILAVAGRARGEANVDGAADVEILLPRAAVGLDDLRRNPEEMREGSLIHFVAASAASILREGVTFGRADDEHGGIRVALRDRGVTVDLTDRAVADVILIHLQPRFRALLEGVVK